jgi:hypothetical protein
MVVCTEEATVCRRKMVRRAEERVGAEYDEFYRHEQRHEKWTRPWHWPVEAARLVLHRLRAM